ncbi:hypothetical protein DSM106972_038460 [Dulcicalothrix desertica PCC 7102]|uniref:Filamentous haemagglutinin FhaB/tRNA nuclease CdiA-like TPS domain-containing protein n=1 Tax=Dulcicalothrix desertica PCC 7102 TaxID=232991 RepID=A0A433VG24_9CYAN|nr:hypothetical protein DSM106972_038460 [Dulcicalothrix desertica PCC 7102]TWH43412.1 filamentous hemagglutinin family protein [Dulcicalothrix desertica PCC 7102]
MKNKSVNTYKLVLHSLGGVILSLSASYPVLAEITPDTTLPVNSTVSTQGNIKVIGGGTQRESNLFHSFKDFSFSTLTPEITGNTAFFNNDVGVINIITRVTGGLPSNIDGIIKANGAANLFILNPAGILFGQNTRLNINTFAKIKRAFCSRVMLTRLQLKHVQKAHAKYISTTGMLTTTYDKNNFETLESNHTSNTSHEWKNNHAGHITMVWKGGQLSNNTTFFCFITTLGSVVLGIF